MYAEDFKVVQNILLFLQKDFVEVDGPVKYMNRKDIYIDRVLNVY